MIRSIATTATTSVQKGLDPLAYLGFNPFGLGIKRHLAPYSITLWS
jgi:hypothetical protein